MTLANSQPPPEDGYQTQANLKSGDQLPKYDLEAGTLDISDAVLRQEKADTEENPHEPEHKPSNDSVDELPYHEPTPSNRRDVIARSWQKKKCTLWLLAALICISLCFASFKFLYK